MIIPNIWKNKKCSKPPISVDQPRIFWLGKCYEMIWNDQWNCHPLQQRVWSSQQILFFQVCQLPFMMLSKQAVSKMLDSTACWDCDIYHPWTNPHGTMLTTSTGPCPMTAGHRWPGSSKSLFSGSRSWPISVWSWAVPRNELVHWGTGLKTTWIVGSVHLYLSTYIYIRIGCP